MRWAAHIILLLIATAAFATGVDKPIYVEVFVRPVGEKGSVEKITGSLIAYDETSLTIKGSGDPRLLPWSDLTSSSAFVVRSRLIDKTKAHDWLELGRFGWSMGAKDQARSALATAVKMDAVLKPDVATILASAPGGATTVSKPATLPSNVSPAQSAPGLPPAQTKGNRVGKADLVKYQPSTPAEDAAAIEHARRMSARVSEELGVQFSEFQTDHFICFNDWDPRETNFLRKNLEGAYATVSKQFDIPVSENIFIGKLPVFMFARQSDFLKFSQVIDGFTASKMVAGYYAGVPNGVGHMAMWKPVIQPDASGNSDIHAAEINWAYVLTHEFTHAFIARYGSNEQIPRWLNEGLAEVIANSKFPRDTAWPFARMMAIKSSANFLDLFDDDKMPGGEMYPVMMTMVQMLIQKNRQVFIAYVADLKSGMDPDKALKNNFGLTDEGLIDAWKHYVTSQ